MLADIFHIVARRRWTGGDGVEWPSAAPRRVLLYTSLRRAARYDRSAPVSGQPRGSLMTPGRVDTSRTGSPSRATPRPPTGPFIKRRRRRRRRRMRSAAAHGASATSITALPSDVLAASNQLRSPASSAFCN